MGKILHIIDSLSGAGPSRSLQASVQYLNRLGHAYDHVLLTLSRPNYPPALLRARKAGISIHQAPGDRDLHAQIASADIVEVHYWNNPAFMKFLCSELPAHRRLAWFKVLGKHAPQVISPPLLNAFDAVMVSSEISLELPAFRKARHLKDLVEVVPGLMEPGRLKNYRKQAHEGFVVTYIGTANTTKMHPDFVAMSAAANIPDARFVVCGSGEAATLQTQALNTPCPARFEFRGYVENIRPVLEISDVFGYPLCENTWATSEKSLQEAMSVGVPPVVFPHGGVAAIVRHDQTGLVVNSPKEYSRAIEYLYHHPEERLRLGRNAIAAVQSKFDGGMLAERIHRLYQKVLECEPVVHPPLLSEFSAAERYARCMLPEHTEFRDSLLAGASIEGFGPDKVLSTASMPVTHGEGGVVQFRNAHPEESGFLLWSGLIASNRGQWQLALSEFERAMESGDLHWRLAWYTAVAAHRVHGPDQAASLFSGAIELAGDSGLSGSVLLALQEQINASQPELFPV